MCLIRLGIDPSTSRVSSGRSATWANESRSLPQKEGPRNGSTEIRTRVTGFKVPCANQLHYKTRDCCIPYIINKLNSNKIAVRMQNVGATNQFKYYFYAAVRFQWHFWYSKIHAENILTNVISLFTHKTSVMNVSGLRTCIINTIFYAPNKPYNCTWTPSREI